MKRVAVGLILVGGLAGCGGPRHYAGHWDGRRGYDGSGDYGYSGGSRSARSEARHYRSMAQQNYPVPGTPDDPWGPYIQEASQRFGIPARWVREVMRQESGGHLVSASGSLTTSSVGAMGLMQVMPATYDILRRRYSLGDDPYDPHNNIMAGSAYIREMYERFGSPGFLAAYNAGPERLNSYLSGAADLPDETVNYVARIAPRLGTEVAMSGPLSTYAPALAAANTRGSGGGVYGGASVIPASYQVAQASPDSDPASQAYAGGGMSGRNYWSSNRWSEDDTGRSHRQVAAAAPLPMPPSAPPAPSRPAPAPAPVYASALPRPVVQPASYTRVADASLSSYAPPPQPASYRPSLFARANAAEMPPNMSPPPGYLGASRPPAVVVPARYAMHATPPVVAYGGAGGAGGWAVQVGAFPDPGESRRAVRQAQSVAGAPLAAGQVAIVPVSRNGGTLYRARMAGLSSQAATAACEMLSHRGTACFAVPPGS